mgnify:CR=1 FL=1
MIHVTINGKPVEVSEGSTIMEAAETVGIRIPSLCHMKNVHQYGSCRICVVEVEGMKNLQASCIAKVREGMVIKTNSPKVRASRKVLSELLLSNHPKDCLNCGRNQNCELQELGYELGVTESRFEGELAKSSVDIPLHHPGYQQMYPLPPLCHRLQQDPARGRHPGPEPRL